ncbi:MAG: Macrolide export ATP-binding/permease protein MacB [Lentisphaerae bacterium ADurb.Bin242]|nr:MAG: Macrolide export ATP-binding/permease protein MacB [Lentisphaerae bacterium ADurb.Bin242]
MSTQPEKQTEALYLEDLHKTYRTGTLQVPVLKGVNFDVKRGEFIGIMGSSGSGKSTLLNILGMLDKPTSGTYRIDGIAVETLSDRDLTTIRNIKIGFVFQAFNLFAHLTVQENIEVPMIYAGVSKHIRRETACRTAEKVRLAHRLDHRPTQLSGGECQRVAIARALVNNPTFILADEPTGNLDEKTGSEIMALFHELHRNGTTIVMVTHNPQYEKEYDRIIYLRNGRKWRVVNNLEHTSEEFETE